MTRGSDSLGMEVVGAGGRYRLQRYLGGGATSKVYAAEVLEHIVPERAGQVAALKLMALGPGDRAQARFFQEADLLVALRAAGEELSLLPDGRGVPLVWAVERNSAPPFFVMSLPPGRPLAELLAGGLGTDWASQERAALQIASGVLAVCVALHEKLNRSCGDLQPASIYWDAATQRVTVVDWDNVSAAGQGNIGGNLVAVAGLLYRLMTGREPGDVTRPGLTSAPGWEHISAGTRAILLRALDPRPASRYQSARSFYEAAKEHLGCWAESGTALLDRAAAQEALAAGAAGPEVGRQLERARVLFDLAQRVGLDGAAAGRAGELRARLAAREKALDPLNRGRDLLLKEDYTAAQEEFEAACQPATSLGRRLAAWRGVAVASRLRAARRTYDDPKAARQAQEELAVYQHHREQILGLLEVLEPVEDWNSVYWQGHEAVAWTISWPGIEPLRAELTAYAALQEWLQHQSGGRRLPDDLHACEEQATRLQGASGGLERLASGQGGYGADAWAFLGGGDAETGRRLLNEAADAAQKRAARLRHRRPRGRAGDRVGDDALAACAEDEVADPGAAGRVLDVSDDLVAAARDDEALELLYRVREGCSDVQLLHRAGQALELVRCFQQAGAMLLALQALYAQRAAAQGRDLAEHGELAAPSGSQAVWAWADPRATMAAMRGLWTQQLHHEGIRKRAHRLLATLVDLAGATGQDLHSVQGLAEELLGPDAAELFEERWKQALADQDLERSAQARSQELVALKAQLDAKRAEYERAVAEQDRKLAAGEERIDAMLAKRTEGLEWEVDRKRASIEAAKSRLDDELEEHATEIERELAAKEQALADAEADLDARLQMKSEQVENALKLMEDSYRRELQNLRARTSETARGLEEELARQEAARRAQLQAEAADMERSLQGRVAARRQDLESVERAFQARQGQLDRQAEDALRSQRQAEQELASAVDRKRQNLAELEEACRARSTELDATRAELDRSATVMQEMSARLETIRREMQTADGDFQAKRDGLEAQLAGVRATCEQEEGQLQVRMEVQRRELQAVEHALEGGKAGLAAQLEQTRQASQQQQELESRMQTQRDAVAHAETEAQIIKAGLLAQLAELRQAAEQEQAELTLRTGQLRQEMEDASLACQARRAELEAQVDGLQQACRQEEAALQGVQAAVRAREASEWARLQQELAQRLAQVEAEQRQALEARLSAARAAHEEAYAAAAEAQRQRVAELAALRDAQEAQHAAAVEALERQTAQREALAEAEQARLAGLVEGKRRDLQEAEAAFAARQELLNGRIAALDRDCAREEERLRAVQATVRANEEAEWARMRQELATRLSEIEVRERAALDARLAAVRAGYDQEHALATEAHQQRVREIDAARAAGEREHAAAAEVYRVQMHQLDIATAAEEQGLQVLVSRKRQELQEAEHVSQARKAELELQLEGLRIARQQEEERLKGALAAARAGEQAEWARMQKELGQRLAELEVGERHALDERLAGARADYDREYAAATQAHAARMTEMEAEYTQRSTHLRALQEEEGRLAQHVGRLKSKDAADRGRRSLVSPESDLRERILELADTSVRSGSIEDLKRALGDLKELVAEVEPSSWEGVFLQPWLAAFRRRHSQATHYWDLLSSQFSKGQHFQVLTIADLLLALGVDGNTRRYEILRYESQSVRNIFLALKNAPRKQKGERRETLQQIATLLQRQEWIVAYDPDIDLVWPDAKIEMKTTLEDMRAWWVANTERRN